MCAKPFRALTPAPRVCCVGEAAFPKDRKAPCLGDGFSGWHDSPLNYLPSTSCTSLRRIFFVVNDTRPRIHSQSITNNVPIKMSRRDGFVFRYPEPLSISLCRNPDNCEQLRRSFDYGFLRRGQQDRWPSWLGCYQQT